MANSRNVPVPSPDLDAILSMEKYINVPAVNKKIRQIEYLARTIGGYNESAWLLKAITLIDLTSLSSNDIPSNIRELCRQATHPINLSSVCNIPFHTAAVCVYPTFVEDAVQGLQHFAMYGEVRVASVAAGFPSGQYPLETRLREITLAMGGGAHEIDVVINRSLVIQRKWKLLYDELVHMRFACEGLCMKTILATGDLPSLKDIYYASMIAMYAGTDFIKTSTGTESVNATLAAGIVMCRAIKDYYRKTNRKVGLKPAGGIKTSQDALKWMVLVKEQLGESWLNKDLFRIGASSLLNNVADKILQQVT